MSLLDWLALAFPLLLVLGVALYAKRYMKSVSGFLSGERLAERYLLAVSKGEMQAGAVIFVAYFEMTYRSGFVASSWWGWLSVPIYLIVAISGFVVYRFRETRAMTLAQFFEIRYSRRFRLATGVLAFAAGVINFGIIPAIGARFFVYFLRLPSDLNVFGTEVPTYVFLMGAFLSLCGLLTLSGGHITVMITNCVEGIISQLLYLVIIFGLLAVFSWSQIVHVMGNRPSGHSMLNPFDSSAVQDFNLWYVLMGTFLTVYGTMAFQNMGAYNSAALNAHESRMGGILGRWRDMGKSAVVTLLGIGALTFVQHPDFSLAAAPAKLAIEHISDPQVREQMRIPLLLSYFLPVGIKGVVCAVILMGVLGGDSMHLHSWGSILAQDVIMPLRKKPLTPRQHIRLLRICVVAVAAFAFLFGFFFRQTEYVFMWWQLTTAVYVGGAGSAIIGGLYWKRGTTAGAWTAVSLGSALSLAGILARQRLGARFPLNGMEISFYTTLISIAAYVSVSLLTRRAPFNMERMLHRGPYSIADREEGTSSILARNARPGFFQRLVGFDEVYSRGDKWIAGSVLGWSLLWFSVLVVGTVWNLIVPWPEAVWAAYWHVAAIGLPIVMSVVTGVWFTWGGIRDVRSLFLRLRASKVNVLDNGMVVQGKNLDESVSAVSSPSPRVPEIPWRK